MKSMDDYQTEAEIDALIQECWDEAPVVDELAQDWSEQVEIDN